MSGNVAIGRRVILKDLQGNYLLPYTDTGSGGNPDNKTIIKTDDPLAPVMVAVGTKTKDGQYNYDWIGTQEEYQEAVANGTIQDNWMCYIIDDYGTDVQDITQLTKGCSAETMLDGKYFDRPTFNPCWLLSDSTKKDGTICSSAYSALIDELNDSIAVGEVGPSGYTKRGLPVKDSSATDITDFDFVVYQDETKFKLPTKILKAAGYQIENDETSTTGLYLYFYIGNTVTNLEIITGGAVLHSLNKKANVDADNFSNIGKDLISSLGMPSNRYVDLTLGASGSTYIAPANGWVYFYKRATASGQYIQMRVKDKIIDERQSSYPNATLTSCMPVLKGDVIECFYTAAGTTVGFYFLYAEGAK